MLLNEIKTLNESTMRKFKHDDWMGFGGTTDLPGGETPYIGEVEGTPSENNSAWSVILGGNEQVKDGYAIWVGYFSDEHDMGDEFGIKDIKKDTPIEPQLKACEVLLKGLKGKDWEEGKKLLKTAKFNHIEG